MRSEDLLEQHDARKLVRQGKRSKRDSVVGVGQFNPVGSTDHKAQRSALELALTDELGKTL
jgi:hypothetical protein